MFEASTICEQLGELGELRLYRRHGPPEHFAAEILRETDGRAWTLRIPWPLRSSLRHLLADSLWRLTSGGRPPVTEGDYTVLNRVLLGPGDEVLTLFLEGEDDRAFAIWRRELLQRGEWSWTLDLVIVPDVLASALCTRIIAGLDRLERPTRPGG